MSISSESTASDREVLIRRLFSGVITTGYATHRPALCEAVLRTSGSIIELGVGEGSTMPLHGVATECGRKVFSFDHDLEWIRQFEHLRNDHHYIAWLPSWDDCPIESQFWSLALVDHAPAERRVVDIRRLAFRAELLVVHDTEDEDYGYESVIGSFASRLDYRKYRQWTTLLSNYIDLSHWQIAE